MRGRAQGRIHSWTRLYLTYSSKRRMNTPPCEGIMIASSASNTSVRELGLLISSAHQQAVHKDRGLAAPRIDLVQMPSTPAMRIAEKADKGCRMGLAHGIHTLGLELFVQECDRWRNDCVANTRCSRCFITRHRRRYELVAVTSVQAGQGVLEVPPI